MVWVGQIASTIVVSIEESIVFETFTIVNGIEKQVQANDVT